jgi:hypothetical protein
MHPTGMFLPSKNLAPVDQLAADQGDRRTDDGINFRHQSLAKHLVVQALSFRIRSAAVIACAA